MPTSKQLPLISKTMLTKRWTLITRYKTMAGKNGVQLVQASQTIDIHDQMLEVLKADRMEQQKKVAARLHKLVQRKPNKPPQS